MLQRHLIVAVSGLVFWLIALGLTQPVFAVSLEQQRASFLAAENALKRGDPITFSQTKKRLRDYPLYPYLEYQALRKRIATVSPAEVGRFLNDYSDTPLAWMMRNTWLDHLAARGRWKAYTANYAPSRNVTRKCHYLRGLISTGQADKAFEQVADIWLHGRSRPRACDPVFDAWQKAGHRDQQLIWERIEKAMLAGQRRLAGYLGRSLSQGDQVWVKRWIELHRNPELAGDSGQFAAAHPYRESMLSQAVRRLAVRNGLRASRLWKTLKPKYAFSNDQINGTEHYILRNLVREPSAEAYSFIKSVKIGSDDTIVLEERIRSAMLREDWPQIATWIVALPPALRDEPRWQYWLARATESTAGSAAARPIYENVAKERTYYGFLAADRTGVDYHLAHADTPASEQLVAEVADLEAVQRARELFALDRPTQARREWRAATRSMDTDHLKAAAKLAKRYGWHDRAIFTLAKTGYWDDLELRFPLEHAQLVDRNATKHGIDNAWVFAVMRQESAFMSNARSHAGAMGLMQLMPTTARNVARDVLNRKPPRRRELLDPDTNIALGSAYLKQMKGELGGSAVLATAAYNAGPHRVTRWLPKRTLPADIWIELVPFKETRGYLRRVLAYTVIYEKRMGKDPTRLHKRLHPVPPNIGLIGSIKDRRKAATTG